MITGGWDRPAPVSGHWWTPWCRWTTWPKGTNCASRRSCYFYHFTSNQQRWVAFGKVTTQTPGTSRSERHSLIKSHVLAAGTVTVDELTANYGISVMTAHRDLEALEQDGWLVKVRGGAKVHPLARLDTSVRARLGRMTREKDAMARQALRYINVNDVVLLDDSTSSLAVARQLPEDMNLTVVTNFLQVINDLRPRDDIELMAVGGTYNPVYDGFFGLVAIEQLAGMHGDVLMMSTSAVHELACCHKSQETVQVKRAFMACAAKKILLVDHTKFGHRAMHRLAPVAEFDVVIVDENVDASTLTSLRKTGAEVEVASLGREDDE